MAGKTVTAHFPFVGGLDEKTSAIYLSPETRQASVLNGDFVKVGAVDKRLGMQHLPNSLVAGGALSAITSGTRVVGWTQSVLSVLSTQGLYQYVPAEVGGTSAGGLVGVCELPAVDCIRRQVPATDNAAPPTLVDMTYGGRLLRLVVSWDTQYNISASVIDVDANSIVLEPTVVYVNNGTLAGGTVPVVVSGFDLPGIANGNPRPVVVIHDLSTKALKYVQYNPSTNAFTAATTIVASCTYADAAPYESDPANGWLVLYDVPGSPAKLRLAYWTTSGVQTTVDETMGANGAGETLFYSPYVTGKYGADVFVFWGSAVSGGSVTYYRSVRQRAADHTFGTSMPVAFVIEATTGSGVFPSGSAAAPNWGIAALGSGKLFVASARDQAVSSRLPGYNTYSGVWWVLSYAAGAMTQTAAGHIPLGLIPAARPFAVAGEAYQAFYLNYDYVSDTPSRCVQQTLYFCKFWGVSASMGSASTLLVDICRPVATVAPRIAQHDAQARLDYLTQYRAGLVSNPLSSTTRAAVGIKTVGADGAIPPRTSDVSRPPPNYVARGPSWAVEFRWDAAATQNLYQGVELGTELSISAGVPMVSDGQLAFEDNFFAFPEMSYLAATGAATTLATGSYTAAVVFRAVDAAGLTHRSAPWITNTLSVTNGGAGPVLNITPPMSSYRDVFATFTAGPGWTPGRVYADVYCTVTNGGTLYYHGSVAATNITTWPDTIAYNITALPDTRGQILYTTGGVLDGVCPPVAKYLIAHQGRKALVDETLRNVWFSTKFADGEAPRFNEALVIPYAEGGDIKALGSFEGKFVVFKQRSIWVMEGEGPGNTGQGSSWTEPESLATDVGAKNWQSVVTTPRGIMFQAPDNRICLLARDLQISDIGKAVVDLTDAYPNIVGSVCVPSDNQVRFLCQDAAGTGHLVICYDYVLDQWTTHQYARVSAVPVSVGMSYGTPQQYTVLTSDGQIWQERLKTDANKCQDQDSAGVNYFVPTTVKTPWIKTQTQGFNNIQLVEFLGERQDDCGLQLQLAFGYDSTVKQTGTWTNNDLNALKRKGQVAKWVGALYNKQMSVQVTFTDTAGTAMTTGAGMRFVATAVKLQNLGDWFPPLSAGARK